MASGVYWEDFGSPGVHRFVFPDKKETGPDRGRVLGGKREGGGVGVAPTLQLRALVTRLDPGRKPPLENSVLALISLYVRTIFFYVWSTVYRSSSYLSGNLCFCCFFLFGPYSE